MKIFLSYSRDDAGNFAKHIYRYLIENGHTVFIDINSIRIGDPWENSIEKNISECDIFVVIITPDSLRSNHVADEVLFAQKENKTIVPCIHECVNYKELKWDLEKIQGIEFADKYELVMRLYSKIRNYDENKEPIDDVSESFSTSVETTTTAVTPATKSDTDRLQQQKDIRKPSNENIQNYKRLKNSNDLTKIYTKKQEKRKFIDKDYNIPIIGINRKIIIIPIIAVAILGLVGSISYFGLFSDKIPPTILSTFPADGMQLIPINTSVYADFSKLMDISTINPSTFTLNKNNESSILVGKIKFLTANGKGAMLNPLYDLEPGTLYTATITKDVKDISGNAMAIDKTWSFETAATEAAREGSAPIPPT